MPASRPGRPSPPGAGPDRRARGGEGRELGVAGPASKWARHSSHRPWTAGAEGAREAGRRRAGPGSPPGGPPARRSGRPGGRARRGAVARGGVEADPQEDLVVQREPEGLLGGPPVIPVEAVPAAPAEPAVVGGRPDLLGIRGAWRGSPRDRPRRRPEPTAGSDRYDGPANRPGRGGGSTPEVRGWQPDPAAQTTAHPAGASATIPSGTAASGP